MRDRFVPLLLLLLHTATTTLSTSSRALFPLAPSTNISVTRFNNSALGVFLAFDEYGDTLPNASADLRYVFTHATSSTFAKASVLGERYVYAGPPKIRVLASDYGDDRGLSNLFPNPTQSVSYFSVQLQRAEAVPRRNGTKNDTLPPAYVTIATYYSLPWVSTEICSNGFNYLNDTNSAGDLEPNVRLWTCNLCPKRAACPGGNANYWHNVRAKFGSWRENQANRGVSNFSKCLAPVMCLGEPNVELRNRFLDPETGEDLALQVQSNATEGCNKERGAYGPLCGQCIHGYYRATHTFECTKCGDVGLVLGLILLALVVLVAVLIGVIIFTVKNEATDSAVDLQMVKIMVNHLAISSGTSKLPLRWAPWLERMFEVFEVFSITLGDDGTPLSLACVSRKHPWLDATLFLAVAPIFVILLTLLMLRPNERCIRWWKVRHKINSKAVAKVTMMVFLLLIHTSLTRQGIKYFACRDVGKISSPNHFMVLDMDFGYRCDDPFITTLRFAVGLPMLILYGIGIPLFYFTRLWRHRDDLNYLKNVYGFLLAGFRDERYYWELWNTIRKAIFAIASIVFAPMGVRMHLWATLGVLQLFCWMEYWGHPHSLPFMNRLEDLALTSDMWQVIFGLGLFFATDAGFTGSAEACSLAIFLLNVLFIIYWVYVWWLHSEYRAKAAESGKNTYIATRRAVGRAAIRTSDGVRTVHGAVRSKIIRISKSKSINNSVINAQKKNKKKKRPSCLLTEEDFAESEEEVLPRTYSTDITVNSVLHEVRNPLDQAYNVELEMSMTHRPSMLASAVKERDDPLRDETYFYDSD